MDVFLLVASGGLGTFLPIQDNVQSSKSVRLALGLSLALFSLSIIEVAPSNWLAFLSRDELEHVLSSSGNLTVMGAYAIVLWIFVVGIVIILPGSVGGQVFQIAAEHGKDDADDKKYSKRWKSPWWIRYTWQFTLLILSICTRIVMVPLLRIGQRHFQRLFVKEPVLIMTNNNSHHDGSRHGVKTLPHSKLQASSIPFGCIVLGGICGIMTTLFFLQTLGSLVIRLHSRETHVLASVVSWLCAIGLLISSSLNGFGSVSLPYSCLSGIFLESVRPEIIAKAEMELRHSAKSMESKIAELQSDSHNSSGIGDSSVSRRRAVSGKITFSDFNSDESSRRKRALQDEIEFLDTLIEELKEDILEMKHAQEQASSARTMWGKVRSYAGCLFSVVLLIRLYTASRSILLENIGPKPEQEDPITSTLLWLTGHNFVSTQDYNTLSQGISLMLTAILSASQIRSFLRTVSAVNRRFILIYRRCCIQRPRTSDGFLGDSAHYKIHSQVLAALTGCYFLSCVVLTKMNLPLQYRTSFAGALGGMEYTIRTPVVNLVFCGSAGISAMVLSLLFGIQRQNTKRYGDDEGVASVGIADVC
ncbi:Abscisic acid G-protein coupled receptor [Fragilaria crotonensis]|nr:Abscisic acid G-protein coupled receptor [Fragilaria crotonensis]